MFSQNFSRQKDFHNEFDQVSGTSNVVVCDKHNSCCTTESNSLMIFTQKVWLRQQKKIYCELPEASYRKPAEVWKRILNRSIEFYDS